MTGVITNVIYFSLRPDENAKHYTIEWKKAARGQSDLTRLKVFEGDPQTVSLLRPGNRLHINEN